MKKTLLLILVNCILLHSSILLAQNEVLAVETTPSATPSAELRLPTVHILPDNPLYFLKTIKEKIQLAFTRNTSNQANLLLSFAQKRLAEALKVAEKGKVHISEKLLEAFGQDIKLAQEKITVAKAKGERTYGLLVKLQETVVYQKEVIEELQIEFDEGYDKIEQRPGILDWLKGLFGRKEILSPLVR